MLVENEDLLLLPQCRHRHYQCPPDVGGGHSLGTMVSPGWFRGRRKHSDVRNVGNGSGRKQPKVLEKWD